jgi:thiol peroxidase
MEKGVNPMAQERTGVITFKGNPMTLIGPELKVGDQAPDFKALANDLSEVTLSNSKGKTRILSVVPSLDTGVCDEQCRKFQELGKGKNFDVITVSMDLPFAQKRWAAAANVTHTLLSDHRDGSFGQAYGVLIKELRLLTRSIFVVGPDDKLKHVEYVKEVTTHPNYDAAVKAAAG